MVHSPSIPEGSKSETREERLRAKLLKLSVEEPEIMRDTEAAAAKWSEKVRLARADFILQAAERRKTLARQSEPKTPATTLHCGIVLAVVLIIAGVTFHISHSKNTSLQASPVDQVQNTAGGTVREPARNTVGNLHEYKEDNWMKKNTPENSSSASLQGVKQSNDHITTVQDTLMTPVGDIVGDTVENMSGFTRNNKKHSRKSAIRITSGGRTTKWLWHHYSDHSEDPCWRHWWRYSWEHAWISKEQLGGGQHSKRFSIRTLSGGRTVI